MKRTYLTAVTLLALLSAPNLAKAATEVDDFSTAEGTFDALIVPATDLLLNRPITASAGPDFGFTLPAVNDGAASSGGNGGNHDSFFSNGAFNFTSLASNPVINIALDTSAATGSTTGFTLSSITTINGWQNYNNAFSDQAYSVYYSTVSAPTTFSLLASVNYHPFADNNGQGGSNSSVVVLTDLTDAVGVSNLEFVLTPSTGPLGTDPQAGSVIREFEATGVPTLVTLAPEPSTYALMFVGAAGLMFLARRKSVRL